MIIAIIDDIIRVCWIDSLMFYDFFENFSDLRLTKINMKSLFIVYFI